jgi:DNA-binding CsgD family transcriptional regulator
MWPKLIDMSKREIEALTWAARGKTSAEIAMILGLSKRTVDFHIDNARIKLGATTRIEAAIKAATRRLIHPWRTSKNCGGNEADRAILIGIAGILLGRATCVSAEAEAVF